MKVLFLDIDGVCNSAESLYKASEVFSIDPHMALLVGRIIIETGCQVVLSSSWRHSPEGIHQVQRKVCKLLDTTGRSKDHFRGTEIREWLAQHPEVTRYAILDDDDDFWKDQPLFQTSWETGLTEKIALAVSKHLNKDQL